MSFLKRLKENILDDFTFVLQWRAYVTLSLLVSWFFIQRSNEVLAWGLSDTVRWRIDYWSVTVPLTIDVVLILYYVVLLVLMLTKRHPWLNPEENGMSQLVPYRWMAALFFGMTLTMGERLYSTGVTDISPNIYPLAIISFISMFVVTEIAFLAKLFRWTLPRSKNDENPQDDHLKTDDSQGISRKDEKTP